MVRKLAGNTIDLVLLDIGLQQESGLDLMKTALLDTGVPVVILTGKSDPIERVVGLELGADDYIVKPYLKRELLARIRAVLRRTAAPQSNGCETRVPLLQEFASWRLDIQSRRVYTTEGTNVDLTGTEFDLLAALARNAGTAMSRSQLSRLAMNRDWAPNDRSLDIHIHNLRRKLLLNKCDGGAIMSVRNVGYLLAAEPVTK